MKINRKVRCIKKYNDRYITIGKEYTILKITSIPNFYDIRGATYYTILNDNNEEYSVESGQFIDIQDQRKKKLNKLNNE